MFCERSVCVLYSKILCWWDKPVQDLVRSFDFTPSCPDFIYDHYRRGREAVPIRWNYSWKPIFTGFFQFFSIFWLDFMLGFMQNLSSIIPREAVSFVFPRVLMFPETNKTNCFPWDLTLSVYYIYKRWPLSFTELLNVNSSSTQILFFLSH